MLTKKVERTIGELESNYRDEENYPEKSGMDINELRQSLECGYHPEQHRNGYILIDKNNKVRDGNHRMQILRKLHDNDHVVEVKLGSMLYFILLIPQVVITVIYDLFANMFTLKVSVGFNGSEYSFMQILYESIKFTLLTPIRLLMRCDKYARDRVKKIRKIIRINKDNPYKHHEK